MIAYRPTSTAALTFVLSTGINFHPLLNTLHHQYLLATASILVETESEHYYKLSTQWVTSLFGLTFTQSFHSI